MEKFTLISKKDTPYAIPHIVFENVSYETCKSMALKVRKGFIAVIYNGDYEIVEVVKGGEI